MIRFVEGDIFLSRAQTIGHGVNAKGFMGAGVAAEMRRRFPAMFREYRFRCQGGGIVPGGYWLYKDSDPWILNFVTQAGIDGARLEFVRASLTSFAQSFAASGVRSLAIPTIGAGLGGLDWNEIKPLVEAILGPLPIPVFVYGTYAPGKPADEEGL